MKIVVEANSIDELVVLLERLVSPPPVITSTAKKSIAVSIDALSLSTRAFNVLVAAGIHQIDQLLKMSDNDLLRLPHLGKHSLREIRVSLKHHGFS